MLPEVPDNCMDKIQCIAVLYPTCDLIEEFLNSFTPIITSFAPIITSFVTFF